MNGDFNKLMKTREMFLVGAPGFEPGASCAQGRSSSENNRPVFNVPAETKQLRRDSSMWLAVRKCAYLSVGWAQKLAQFSGVPWPRFAYRNMLAWMLARGTILACWQYPPAERFSAIPPESISEGLNFSAVAARRALDIIVISDDDSSCAIRAGKGRSTNKSSISCPNTPHISRHILVEVRFSDIRSHLLQRLRLIETLRLSSTGVTTFLRWLLS